MEAKKYIGQNEIVNIAENDVETFELGGMTKVSFVDGTEKEFTNKQLSYLITDEPKDLTQLRDLVLSKVIPDILGIFELHNINKGDIQSILNGVVGSYNETFNQAIGKAFGTYDEKLHSSYFSENIRVSEIKKFI